MTTTELLRIVEDRKLRIEVRDGRPVLIRPNGNTEVTDKLLAVLKRHRDRIINQLARPQE